jgi:hypothetical protein
MTRVAACNEKPSTNADSAARRSVRGNNAGAGVADVASSASSRPSISNRVFLNSGPSVYLGVDLISLES